MKCATCYTEHYSAMSDLLAERTDIHGAVFVALGAASACWDNLSGAGERYTPIEDEMRAKCTD